MRTAISRALLAGAIVAGTAGLGAPPAVAATWTVTGGPNFTATNAGNLLFKITSSGQTYLCTASTIQGTVSNGTAVAHITSGTLSGCASALGATATGTISAGTFTPVSYAPTPAPGMTSYVLTGVTATFTVHNFAGTCSATVTGSANTIKYGNSGTLTSTADPAPGNLTIAGASGSGCLGLIVTGDKATFAGTYNVSPVITITSP